jgi:predicted aconitase
MQSGVPYFRFRDVLPPPESLKTLAAAMAASGAVALFHIEGVTPEASLPGAITSGVPELTIDDLSPAYAALNSSAERIDLVSLGCPHASLEELETIADSLDGRHAKAALWITTARPTRDAAAQRGIVARIEAAGGRVVADTCLVVAPAVELGFRSLATDSAKMAFYAPSHSGLQVRFGPLERCLEAALSGHWVPDR